MCTYLPRDSQTGCHSFFLYSRQRLRYLEGYPSESELPEDVYVRGTPCVFHGWNPRRYAIVKSFLFQISVTLVPRTSPQARNRFFTLPAFLAPFPRFQEAQIQPSSRLLVVNSRQCFSRPSADRGVSLSSYCFHCLLIFSSVDARYSASIGH